MKRVIAFTITFIMMVGCSSGVDSYSQDDMCIVHIESDQKVCYGDSRSDAEEIVGRGERDDFGWFKYADGVSLGYRDDKVVMMTLYKESQGIYATARGSSVGDLKDDIMKMYGKENAIDLAEKNLDYIYDKNTGKYLDRGPESASIEERENIYHVISAMLDDDGYAYVIMILDNRMATFFE